MSHSGDDHLLTTIQEHYSMSGQTSQTAKKQGVSGKSIDPGKAVDLPKVDKNSRLVTVATYYTLGI
jgi:hypothetical protein